MSDVTINGLAELHTLLQTLPLKIEKNLMRGALRAAAKVVQEESKRLAPVGGPYDYVKKNKGRSGALRDSIRIGTNSRGNTVQGYIRAGGKTKDGASVFYAHMVEQGTDSHDIAPRKDKKSMIINGRHVRGTVTHPGTNSQPFMRPALDSMQTAATMAAGNYLKDKLQTKQGLDTSYIMLEGDEL